MRIWDPGWKKVESGINIPDPQYCPASGYKIKTQQYLGKFVSY
jgi:hypothetical protein